ALTWRNWALLFATLLGTIWLGLLLRTGTSLFARYFLFGTFPVFILAGYTLDRLAMLVDRVLWRSAVASMVARTAIVLAGVALVLWPRLGLLHDVVLDPSH